MNIQSFAFCLLEFYQRFNGSNCDRYDSVELLFYKIWEALNKSSPVGRIILHRIDWCKSQRTKPGLGAIIRISKFERKGTMLFLVIFSFTY